MAWSAVQRKSKGQQSGATISIGSGDGWNTPASGNLILVTANSDATVSTPSGYTAGPSVVDGNGAYVFWKISAGNESTITCTPGASVPIVITCAEYSGNIASPLDTSNTSTFSGANGSSTTSVSVTTGADADLIVAAACLHSGAGNMTGPSWTNSFTNQLSQASGGSGSADCVTFYAELMPAGAAGAFSTVASWTNGCGDRQALLIAFKVAADTSIPPPGRQDRQTRDPGTVWWIQRDRRDANTVATAANPLVAPLDTAWQADARYWHLYNDTATRDRRQCFQQRLYLSDPNLLTPAGADPLTLPTGPGARIAAYWDRRQVPQQPQRESDPLLLATAELENELLGGADTAKRANTPATHVPRWWSPRQPRREAYSPGPLDSALLENELLGGAGTGQRYLSPATNVDRRLYPRQRPYVSDPLLLVGPPVTLDPTLAGWAVIWQVYNTAALHADRREVPQQRPYICDPSFYPTVAATDPLTLAWGAGGTYWSTYNSAASRVDRREVAPQRAYICDPGLLLAALLENELLGGADDQRRRTLAAAYTDRRVSVAPRPVYDPNQLATDPLTLAAGVGGDLWRRANTPAYGDRRQVPQQPPRPTLYFDAGPGTPPLTLTYGAGGTYWHLYQWRRPARSWWQPRPVFAPLGDPCHTTRPTTGTTTRPTTGVTARPDTGVTENPC